MKTPKVPFEVKIIYTAIVMAGEDDDVEKIVREEKSEITSDIYNPDVEVGTSYRSRAELAAQGEQTGSEWDDMCIPYGGDGITRLGAILDDIEAADKEKAEALNKRCAVTDDLFEAPRPVEPVRPPDFRLQIARRHAGGAGDDWHWSSMEWIGNGEGAGSLIEGGIPNIAPDGSKRWVGVQRHKVFVSEDQVLAAGLAYEAETGKCLQCGGSAKMKTPYTRADGARYVDCARCAATGKAPSHE